MTEHQTSQGIPSSATEHPRRRQETLYECPVRTGADQTTRPALTSHNNPGAQGGLAPPRPKTPELKIALTLWCPVHMCHKGFQ
jgi:hypothetical protein